MTHPYDSYLTLDYLNLDSSISLVERAGLT